MLSKQSAFVLAASKDPRVLKLVKLMEGGAFSKINPSELVKELKALHETKSIASLSFEKIEAQPAKILVNAQLRNQRSRSRAVAIKIDCFELSKFLEEHIEAVSRYLSAGFNSHLSLEYKTAKDRQAAIDLVLEDFHKMQNKLEVVITIADRVVDDLDKAAWVITNTINLFNLQARRE